MQKYNTTGLQAGLVLSAVIINVLVAMGIDASQAVHLLAPLAFTLFLLKKETE